MINGNTFSKVINKSYSTEKVETVNINAIICQTCKPAVIAEYNAEMDMINLYDFDPYYVNDQKILHPHPADARTKNRVLEMIAAEKGLLCDVDLLYFKSL
ncbi:MAG: hypothetical protein ACRD5J_17715 [Nitrososphaeraceae archaeon]